MRIEFAISREGANGVTYYAPLDRPQTSGRVDYWVSTSDHHSIEWFSLRTAESWLADFRERAARFGNPNTAPTHKLYGRVLKDEEDPPHPLVYVATPPDLSNLFPEHSDDVVQEKYLPSLCAWHDAGALFLSSSPKIRAAMPGASFSSTSAVADVEFYWGMARDQTAPLDQRNFIRRKAPLSIKTMSLSRWDLMKDA